MIFGRHDNILDIINEKAFEVLTPEINNIFHFKDNNLYHNNDNSSLRNKSIFYQNTESNKKYYDIADLEKNIVESRAHKIIFK